MKTFRFEYVTEEGLERVIYKRFKNLNCAYLYVGRELIKDCIKGGVKISER